MQHTTIMVTGGKGGVGKSTTAVGLALSLAKRGRVGLLDADVSGPSIPVVLGLPIGVTVRRQLMQPAQFRRDAQPPVAVMSTGLFGRKDTAFGWDGPLLRGLLKQFRDEVNWGRLDYLVIDTSPGTGETHRVVIDLFRPASLVMVTRPDPASMSDTRRSLGFFRGVVPISAVVLNGASRRCAHCGQSDGLADEAISDELATYAPLIKVPIVENSTPWSSEGDCSDYWDGLADLMIVNGSE